jgi:hypothetical protein
VLPPNFLSAISSSLRSWRRVKKLDKIVLVLISGSPTPRLQFISIKFVDLQGGYRNIVALNLIAVDSKNQRVGRTELLIRRKNFRPHARGNVRPHR